MCSVTPHAPMTGSVSVRSEAENGGEERQHKMVKPDAPTLVESEPEILMRRSKPAIVRSKTLDQSLLLQMQSDGETKTERKKPQSGQFSRFTNAQYRKIFKDISKDEPLRQSYTCALQKDILYQGRLFVTENWICFHSKVFGKDTKIAVPTSSISAIKKTKTAILVPNALVIETETERHLFVSFLSRDTTYKFLMSVCPHLDEKSVGSRRGHDFRVDPTSLPLGFSADLFNTDRGVRQRQNIEDSSSSDSHSPNYEKIPAFRNVVKQGTIPAHQNSHVDQTDSHHKVPSVSEGVTCDIKSLRPVSLNTLLAVYLFLVGILVLSSCYMAFKIISLEERLISLNSLKTFSYSGDDYLNGYSDDEHGEISTVLSMNILTLEKIQRNLQKLLEETQL
ncbi:GRAM domain-containing protein 2B isoform X1 [Chanos chanos]|uniref:GRAM domain-containing protein 2B isoform X1 n=2 Tax=Chanos chanos TaxID=29144 RepID=A0A6J2V9P7_CHACN|nr:GRAM domain-containing protein 2B-like isoform X1 [Chanos chanos]